MGILFFALLAVVVLIIFGGAIMGIALTLLWWALIGLIIGGLGRLILPGPRPIGLLATALIGVAGALLGGIIARAVDVGGVLEFVIAVLVAAVLVAATSRIGDPARG